MPTSSMSNVIQMALEEKGHHYSSSTIQRWIEQKSCPPPHLADVFTAIVENIDHHVTAAQTRALLGKGRNVKALKEVHKKPVAERRMAANGKRQLTFGEEKLHVGYVTVTKEEKEVMTAMARILRVGRSGLIRMWIKAALADVLSEIRPGESFETLMKEDRVQPGAKLPSKVTKDFIRFSRKLVDNSPSES